MVFKIRSLGSAKNWNGGWTRYRGAKDDCGWTRGRRTGTLSKRVGGFNIGLCGTGVRVIKK